MLSCAPVSACGKIKWEGGDNVKNFSDFLSDEKFQTDLSNRLAEILSPFSEEQATAVSNALLQLLKEYHEWLQQKLQSPPES